MNNEAKGQTLNPCIINMARAAAAVAIKQTKKYLTEVKQLFKKKKTSCTNYVNHNYYYGLIFKNIIND